MTFFSKVVLLEDKTHANRIHVIKYGTIFHTLTHKYIYIYNEVNECE